MTENDLMGIQENLAGAMERRDERPNVALAEEIAGRGDAGAVGSLIGLVGSGTARQRQGALKVLYEIGEREPALIAPHAQVFLDLLASHTNRQVRGALQALETIAAQRADTIAAELPRILEAADKGSVIAKECCTTILVRLACAGHSDAALPILIERLKSAAPNQFATYAEETATVVDEARKPGFMMVLRERFTRISEESKRKRVERLMRKMGG